MMGQSQFTIAKKCHTWWKGFHCPVSNSSKAYLFKSLSSKRKRNHSYYFFLQKCFASEYKEKHNFPHILGSGVTVPVDLNITKSFASLSKFIESRKPKIICKLMNELLSPQLWA